MLHLVPGGVQRGIVIKQADPERRQRADLAPAPAVRAAHFEEGLEPHLRKDRGEMVGEVRHERLLALEPFQPPVQEVAEALAGDVVIEAVAVDEVHRHIEREVQIALIAEAVLEHEGQHAGPVRIGVRPDVAAEGEEAVRPAFGEGRIGEERGGERLEGEADAELAGHVAFRGVIEVGLDGTGAQHHVEAERADLRHVVQHDLVAALGHDRQLGAGLVRPHAHAEEAEPELVAYRLALVEVAGGLGAGLVEMLARCAGQLELPRRLQADRAVRAGQRNDVTLFDDRLPAIMLKLVQQVTDASRLVIGGRAVIGAAIDELLVLGADPPRFARLLAFREDGEKVIAVVNRALGLAGVDMGRHRRAFSPARACPPARFDVLPIRKSDGQRAPCRDQSPAAPIHSEMAASAAVSARRILGPSETGRACGSARIAARSSSVKPPSGPIRIAAGPGAGAKASPPASSAK